jgi:hypothetical protein
MPEWRFVYTWQGKPVRGFASVGAPRKPASGIDWEVPLACDRHGETRPIAGISPEHAAKLGKEFLSRIYEGLDLKNEDGTPFSWDKLSGG